MHINEPFPAPGARPWFGKHEPSAFQNRSGNVYSTPESNFMILGRLRILRKTAFSIIFKQFWALTWKLQNGLKIDLDIVETFWDQIWKAEIMYFPFLIKFLKLGSFCNQNGILGFFGQKVTFFSNIPFWFQKGINFCNFVDANFIFGKYGPWAF